MSVSRRTRVDARSPLKWLEGIARKDTAPQAATGDRHIIQVKRDLLISKGWIQAILIVGCLVK